MSLKVDPNRKVTIVNGNIVRKKQEPPTSNGVSTLSTMWTREEYINEPTQKLATGLLAGTITTLAEVKELVKQGAICDVRHLERVFRALEGPIKEYREIVRYFTQDLKIKPTQEVFFQFVMHKYDAKDLDLLPFEGVVFDKNMLRWVVLYKYSTEVFDLFLKHGAPFEESIKHFAVPLDGERCKWIENRYRQLHPLPPKKTWGQKIQDFFSHLINILKKLCCCS